MFIHEIIRKIVYFKIFRRLKSYGTNIVFSRGGTIIRPEELQLGSNIFISKNFYISARSMEIGNDVMVGPNFIAECDDHIYDSVGHTMFSVQKKRNIAPIIIRDDVWIGGNVTILKGVTIGEGSVIAAGSVVTKTTPPYTICNGLPCKPIKPRFSETELKTHMAEASSKLNYETVLRQLKNLGFYTTY